MIPPRYLSQAPAIVDLKSAGPSKPKLEVTVLATFRIFQAGDAATNCGLSGVNSLSLYSSGPIGYFSRFRKNSQETVRRVTALCQIR